VRRKKKVGKNMGGEGRDEERRARAVQRSRWGKGRGSRRRGVGG
jgi:hypothetical protein